MLELHCHTTFSDGTLTPTQLVQSALLAGVKALAITDHDTVAGWNEAIAAAAPHALEIVPGLELSTVHLGRSLHILGFYPDRDRLQAPLQERLAGRQRRAKKMVEKLAALGYPIELPSMSGEMAPGRPHIAAALIKAGYVKTAQEAFERWLGDQGSAYVPYEKFSAADGIQLLRRCGAVPVWAHPYLFRGSSVASVLPELLGAGLRGIEVYHPSHRPQQIEELLSLCRQHGLLITGGSDYHGPAPDLTGKHMGLNQLQVPLALLPPLQEQALQLRGFQPMM
ncbi:MAG: PHP domain-containing protein [Leptolyngbyaceae cyanobacterium RM1_1_2]|nr:PHP domain-containing protein [Leptolyngbyaceae cyanobacterium RM1_1_2]